MVGSRSAILLEPPYRSHSYCTLDAIRGSPCARTGAAQTRAGNIHDLCAAALLVIDLLVPDPIPFLDETLLAVITYALSRWKKPL